MHAKCLVKLSIIEFCGVSSWVWVSFLEFWVWYSLRFFGFGKWFLSLSYLYQISLAICSHTNDPSLTCSVCTPTSIFDTWASMAPAEGMWGLGRPVSGAGEDGGRLFSPSSSSSSQGVATCFSSPFELFGVAAIEILGDAASIGWLTCPVVEERLDSPPLLRLHIFFSVHPFEANLNF